MITLQATSRSDAAGLAPIPGSGHLRCLNIALALLTVTMAGAAEPVEFRKQYVDARYGQLHVLVS